MPVGNPAGLSVGDYLAVTAYLLDANGITAGAEVLDASDELSGISIVAAE
jgi:hypothetical protein